MGLMKVKRIEATFPVPVELSQEHQKALDQILGAICAEYVKANPDRVMWVFGVGSKMLCNPLMLSDDEPIPFDDSVFHFEIAEREK